MNVGILVRSMGSLPAPEMVAYLREMAQKAEALNFYSLWVGDHLVIPGGLKSRYPYSESGKPPLGSHDTILEALTVLAALSTITQRVKLGTNVLVLPYRHPLVTAKILATLDCLSNGRVIVGVGTGWMKEEFEATGAASFEHRGSLADEYIRIFKALWTQGDPHFEGRWYRFSGFGFAPKPLQKPHMPIWVGGDTDAALRRAARLGDGWQPHMMPPEQYAQGMERLRELCQQLGRPFDKLTLSLSLSVTIDLDAKGTRAERAYSPVGSLTLVGDPRQLAAELRRYKDIGVQHLVASHPSIRGQPPSIESTIRGATLFAQEVVSQLR